MGNDAGIQGVIVRIDSPGGEVFASDDIWREMNLLSKKKPMVISMSDVAASGGYYIAMTGDPIVAYPGTLTGSIGVVFGKANLHGLYDKLGITKDMLSRGRFATIDSDYQPLTPDGREKLRSDIEDNYRSFVTKVAAARRRKFDAVEPLAQGRVWLGSQAKANGLIDELGGLDRALEIVKEKAKIPKGERVTLVTYPPQAQRVRRPVRPVARRCHGVPAGRHGETLAASPVEPGRDDAADAIHYRRSLTGALEKKQEKSCGLGLPEPY